MPVVKDNKINLEGTSLRGSVSCTIGAMQEAFGTEGAFVDMVGCCMTWAFRDSNGARWSIYDHKLTWLTDFYGMRRCIERRL